MFISVLHIKVNMGSKENFVGGYDLIEKAIKERSWANIRELARYLHKLEPRCSSEAWRTRVYRYARKQDATVKELLKKEDWLSSISHANLPRSNGHYRFHILDLVLF